jgi:hypothetical protein
MFGSSTGMEGSKTKSLRSMPFVLMREECMQGD